jgi:hypothetical protein
MRARPTGVRIQNPVSKQTLGSKIIRAFLSQSWATNALLCRTAARRGNCHEATRGECMTDLWIARRPVEYGMGHDGEVTGRL